MGEGDRIAGKALASEAPGCAPTSASIRGIRRRPHSGKGRALRGLRRLMGNRSACHAAGNPRERIAADWPRGRRGAGRAH